MSAGQVIGWCDIVPNPRPVSAHVVAIELYKNFGFATERLQRNRILVDGTYENPVLMGVLF